MKYMAKAVSALAVAALLLTGCGSEIDEELPSVLPSIDNIPGKSASVNVHSADAPSEDISLPAPVTEETLSETVTEYETTVKEEFSFTPEYDAEFFENDLFIGDSITTGYSGYGILAEKNIFAKIGLNPLTALDTEVSTVYGDVLLSDAVSQSAPARAYIMLGSNGIEWLACSNMLEAVSDIIDAVHDSSPETQIICLTIPPVTKEHDQDVEDLEVMNKIRDYNSRLAEMCDDKEITCIDITTMLEDNEGYFVYYYAETDGVHFKPTAYKMILSKIEYTLS